MMTDKRRTYTAEFKREAVRLVTDHGYAVAEAARNLGLNAHMLRRWKCQIPPDLVVKSQAIDMAEVI
jgi:transposase-like protein